MGVDVLYNILVDYDGHTSFRFGHFMRQVVSSVLHLFIGDGSLMFKCL